jgi:hypothetical protein
MKEIDIWYFLGYYGVLYLVIIIVSIVLYPVSQLYIKPVVAIVFPIAAGNSLIKSLVVTTVFYWFGVLFNTLVVKKIRIKF